MIDLAIDGRVFIDNILDEALQELDILFNTTNTELIGYPRYGTNFEQFLWQLTPSPNELRNYILERIGDTFYLSQLNTNVNVEVLNGEIRNIYYVKIAVTYNEETKYREYQFR